MRTLTSSEHQRIIDSGLFDAAWYASKYQDVSGLGLDPLDHYMRLGIYMGRPPCALFDVKHYLRQRAQAGEEELPEIPLLDYLESGWQHGLDPHPLFHTRFYLEKNPDVAKSGVEPLGHYLRHGAREDRSPHPAFDPVFYRENYPDVTGSGIAGFCHYVQYGRKEGRAPNAANFSFQECHVINDSPSHNSSRHQVSRLEFSASLKSPTENPAYEKNRLLDLGMTETGAQNFLKEFEAKLYQDANADLGEMDIHAVRQHFFLIGAHDILLGKRRLKNTYPKVSIHNYSLLYPDIEKLYVGSIADHYFLHGLKEIHEGSRPHYSKWKEFVLPKNNPLHSISLQEKYRVKNSYQILCFGWDTPSFESLKLNLKNSPAKVSDASAFFRSAEFSKTDFYLILSKNFQSIRPWDSFFEKIHKTTETPNRRDVQLVYWDEIHTSKYQEYEMGHFKPDFSEHYLWSTNYLGSAALIRGDLLSQASDQDFTTGEEVIYYCALLLSKKPEAFLHIQEPLTKTTVSDCESELHPKEKAVVRNFLKENYPNIEVLDATLPRTFHISLNRHENPLVSIIVPFRDRPELLEECLDSVFSKTTYQNYEVLAVNNGSSEESMQRLKNRYSASKVNFIDYDGDFNYSAINNFAVQNHAQGEFVLLLNNDTAVIEPDWIQQMLQYALEPGVGAVGAKLLYGNEAVQHAGIVMGPFFNVGILFAGKQDADPGYFGRADVTSNCIAVTAACLLVSKEKYMEVDGLDEENFKIAYNDIDFCLKLHQRGYANVHAARAKLFHFESLSRGKDEISLEKTERMYHELWNLKEKCEGYFDEFDPFYNLNFSKISPYAWFEYHEKYVPSKSEHWPVDFSHKINYVSPFSAKKKPRLALFSHYDKHGIIDPYVVHYIKEISKYADLVFISTSPGLSLNQCKKILPFASQIIFKDNTGYDFGAWKTGLVFCEEIINNYPKGLILLNDSIYGPVYALDDYFQAADGYDVYSMTDSYDLKYHLQSYFVSFSQKAISNDNFKKFWDDFYIIKNKISLIFKNEIGFYSSLLADSRLRCGSQIRSRELNSRVNISHFYWKNLLSAGVPFLKVELLRDNPVDVDISDWEKIVAAQSAKLPALIKNHIRRVKTIDKKN